MNENDSASREPTLLGCCPTSLAFTIDPFQLSTYDYESVSSNETTNPCEDKKVRVLLGVLETLIALGAVVGNILVIVSVYTNRKLRTITNLFVVSLAFSDLMVGLLVLPFAIKQEATCSWGLGGACCDIFVTLDVLLCTASILNLCCISLDRYFAITRPLACATTRSKRLALLMIGAVWVLSVIITIPPLFGWREHEENRKKDGTGINECDLVEEKNYVIYSALGSFYIPLAIMLFVYANIFVVARNAQRRWRYHSSKGSGVRSSKPGTTSPAHSPNQSGEPEEQGSLRGKGGVWPRVMRVASSDTVCCGCFGRRQSTGPYEVSVTDDWRLSPGVVAESYNRQITSGFDVTNRSLLIYGTRACAVEHDRGRRCSEEHDSGMWTTRPYPQLLRLGSCEKISDAAAETRKIPSESRISEMEVRLPSTGSGTRDVQTIALSGSTGSPPVGLCTDHTAAVLDKNEHSPPHVQTFLRWRRRHSSLDRVCHKETESKTKTPNDYQLDEQSRKVDLIVRHSGSLPTRLIRNRTVSVTTTTTTSTPSAGSRASTGSGGSGTCAEGNYLSPEGTSNPSDKTSTNIDGSSNRCRSALAFDKHVTPRCDKVTCKTQSEKAEANQNCANARTGVSDSCLFESPRRRLSDTGEFSASFRSVRKVPRPFNHNPGDPRSYGSCADVTMTSTMARQISRLSQKTRRENSVAFRESKTVKTVSIVIGCFVLCWLPFFVVYIMAPFLTTPFSTDKHLKQFVTWLGYFNSVINPFIYAFYNYEFRSTFWQLTIGRVWKGSQRRLPRVVAPSSSMNNVMRYQPNLRKNSVIELNRLAANR